MSASTTASTTETNASMDRRIAGLAALAVAIHVFESALPSPIPGLKPGLANVITLIVLFRYGWAAAGWVTLLRVVGGSLLLGTFLTPTFLLSAGGAILSLAALGLAGMLIRVGLGPVGAGAAAALGHLLGQLVVAWLLFIPHPGLWQLAPFLLAAALPLGIITGLVAAASLNHLRRLESIQT